MNRYHYAAVIGISGYPGIGDLAAPVTDAKAFRDWLLGAGELSDDNIQLLITSGKPPEEAFDARPIKREVDCALEYLNKKARNDIGQDRAKWQQSRLYIYVAGHGIMPRGGETALLLADAREGLFDHIELSKYVEWYRFCGLFQEVVVFADCCRNWFGNVKASVVPFSMTGQPEARVFYLEGWACSAGNPAYEQAEKPVPPDERRGYFTRALLDGLRGAAAVDPDLGKITSATLAGYVSRAVGAATRDKAIPQNVEMRADLTNPIIFGSVTTIPSHRVTLHFRPTWTDPVELLHPDGTRQTWARAPTAWTLQLRAGHYAVVLPGTFDGSTLASEGLFMVTGDRDVRL